MPVLWYVAPNRNLTLEGISVKNTLANLKKSQKLQKTGQVFLSQKKQSAKNEKKMYLNIKRLLWCQLVAATYLLL